MIFRLRSIEDRVAANYAARIAADEAVRRDPLSAVGPKSLRRTDRELSRPPLLTRLLSPSDCADAPSLGYLVKGLIAPGNVACIVGQPGTGKSVIAPHIGYAVAQGRPVFGLRTKPGKVLYLAAEDFTGMKRRVAALRKQYGDATDFRLAECGNLLNKPVADDLLAAVAGWRPALIIIDTLAAAWAGLVENDSDGMGQVVALCLELAVAGAAVILVHHPAKSGDGSPRGSGCLFGALDMVASLASRDEDGVVRCRLSKNRQGSPDLPMGFRVSVARLGMDEDGDAITAPIAAEVASDSSAPPRVHRLPRTEEAALRVFNDLIATDGTEQTDGRVTVPETTWRAACDDQRVSGASDAKGRADVIRRAFQGLTHKGQLAAGGGDVWVPIHPAAHLLASL